jgi:DNA-binding NarL/FixJ family response regulator
MMTKRCAARSDYRNPGNRSLCATKGGPQPDWCPQFHMKVLILKSERLIADALAEVTKRVFPAAYVGVVTTLGDAEQLMSQFPDLLVSGVSARDGDALDFLCGYSQVRCKFKRIRVVTRRLELHVVSVLRQIPIDGVLDSESESIDRCEHALRAIYQGEGYWSPRFLDCAVQCMSPSAICRILTPTERLVFSEIGDGSDDLVVAERMRRKSSTILSVRRALHKKLRVQNRGHLIRIAVQYGVVRISPDGIVRPGAAFARGRTSISRRGEDGRYGRLNGHTPQNLAQESG